MNKQVVHYACQLLLPDVNGDQFFFQSDFTDLPSDFLCAFFGKYGFKPFHWKASRFHFSVGFVSRSCFESDGFIAYSNE